MNVSTLHIGLVGPLPPPYGGMANQTRQLERLLKQEGITVDLVQVNAPYQSVWIGRIWGVRAVFRLVPYLIHLWQAASKVQLFHVMANSGWSWHLFAAPTIWIAWLKGKPVIINYRGGGAEEFFQRSFFWIKPSLLRANTIIVPSGFLKAVFAKNGFPATIVPNIIDLTKFSANIQHQSIHDQNSPHIIVTRNLESIYDNATAIRAFRIIRNIFHNARLTIAGSGPDRQMLEELVDELALQDAVVFAGRINNDAMADLYRTADLMINASLVDNMPISILEALASSVPVVSTSAGGIPFMVEHGKTALLVPIQDPVAMSEAMLQVLQNPAIAQNLVKQGLESIQEYTWPSVKNHLLAVYAQVLKEKSD